MATSNKKEIIGIDFGTTNSTISYFDKESDRLDSFRVAAGDDGYIPTVVAYETTKNNKISIGKEAKENVAMPEEFEVYDNFKLLLGKSADAVIEGKPKTKKTPTQVTHDFISKLLKDYKDSKNIKDPEDIDGIVMTVPEVWTKEDSNRTARENIEGIFKTLGYKDTEFQLQSEPVAAATYFCWSYRKEHKKEYKGFITVIDYGGGTLDVTLCNAVGDGKIIILGGCGGGEYNKTNGCAGVAFDEAVVEALIRNNSDKKLLFKRGDPKFTMLRNTFENQKILKSKTITDDLKDYYDDPNIVEGNSIFSLRTDGGKLEVHCKDLDKCFSEVNAPMLKDSLKKIAQHFDKHGVNTKTPEYFKVLLVGGFSNFYAVEKEVREFFGAKSGDVDKRFEQPFEIRNRALAISRGAALIAAKEYEIDTICDYTYGYVRYGANETNDVVPFYIEVIKEGINIKELSDPIFVGEKEFIRHKGGKLRIYIDYGSGIGKKAYALDESIRELFPNVDDNDRNKWYQIGFSINKNQIPTIHIKDKHGTVTSTSLNKLIEKIGISQ